MSIARIVTQGSLSRPIITLWMPLLPLKRAGKGTVLPLPAMKNRPKVDMLLRNRFPLRTGPGIQTILIRHNHLGHNIFRCRHSWTNIRNELKPNTRNYNVSSQSSVEIPRIYRRILRSTQTNNRLSCGYSKIFSQRNGFSKTKPLQRPLAYSRIRFLNSSRYKTMKSISLRSKFGSWKAAAKEAQYTAWLDKNVTILHGKLLEMLTVMKNTKTFQQMMTVIETYKVKLTPFYNDVRSLKFFYACPQNIAEFKESKVAVESLRLYKQSCRKISSTYKEFIRHPMVVYTMNMLMKLSIEIMNFVIRKYPIVKQKTITLLKKFSKDMRAFIEKKYPDIKLALMNSRADKYANTLTERCLHYSGEITAFGKHKCQRYYPVYQATLVELTKVCTKLLSVAKTALNKINLKMQSGLENLGVREQLLFVMNNPRIVSLNEKCAKQCTNAAMQLRHRYPMLNPNLQNLRLSAIRLQKKLSSETKMLFIRMYPELKSRFFNIKGVWYNSLHEYSRLFSTLRNLKIIRRWKDWAENNPMVRKYYSKLVAFISSSGERKAISNSPEAASKPTESDVQPKETTKTVSQSSDRQSTNIYSQYSNMRINYQTVTRSTMMTIGSREKVMNLSHRYVILNNHSRSCCEHHIIFDLDRLKLCGRYSLMENIPIQFTRSLPTETRPNGSGDNHSDCLFSVDCNTSVVPVRHVNGGVNVGCDKGGASKVSKGMERWANKVAVVTGANSGIGMAVTQKLLNHGMNVVGADRRCENLRMLEEKMRNESVPGKLISQICDVSDDKEVHQLFEEVACHYGGVDVAVCNAGLALPGDLLEGNPCDWRYVMDVNVISLALFAKETVRSVQSRGQEGHIIFIGSVGGHVLSPKEDLHFYMVSKHAVTALTEAFRQELVARKLPIKISKVCPGYVQTDFNVHMFEHHKDKDKKIASYYPKIKMLQPSDIADAILFILATPPHVQVNDILIRSTEELV